MVIGQRLHVQGVKPVGLLFVLLTVAVAGCGHRRVMCAANVEDVGPVVKTKYRYCFANEKLRNGKEFAALKKTYPSVFADDGIPFNASIPHAIGGFDTGKGQEHHAYHGLHAAARQLFDLRGES